jgi:hypothetical protein
MPARRLIRKIEKMTLAEARDIARTWNGLADRGIDPAEQERQAKLDEQRRRKTTSRPWPRTGCWSWIGRFQRGLFIHTLNLRARRRIDRYPSTDIPVTATADCWLQV